MGTRIRDIANPETASPETDRQILTRIVLWAFAFKLFLAVALPLGVDEAYAIAVARDYSLSFFDHPPVSFWLPVAFADLTGLEHRIIYRLPFLVSGVATTLVMYLIGAAIGSVRVGVWTALLYAISPFFLISAGFLVVPDGTLNLASALAVLFLVKLARSDGQGPLRYWVFAGLALAVALGSKYQAAWIPVAVLAFMILTPKGRSWFFQLGPWLGGALGVLGLLPVILWNMQNDWASFAFQTSRAGGGLQPLNLLVMFLGQVLFLLPATMIAVVAGLRLTVAAPRRPELVLLSLIAVGPIVIFNYIYLTSEGSLAHWPMPGWQFALPLAALWLTRQTEEAQKRMLKVSGISMAAIWVPLLILVLHINTGVLTRFTHDRPPAWDNTLPLFGYDGLKDGLATRGLWQDADLFMARGWTVAGQLDTALRAEKPMRISGAGTHHFKFLSDALATGTVLYLEPATLRNSGKADARALKAARAFDPKAELLKPITLTRGGVAYATVSLVRFSLK